MLPERKALFAAAASCQGGSEWPNKFIATVLGITHPIRMEELCERAIYEGLDPNELYPWYMKQRANAIQRGVGDVHRD